MVALSSAAQVRVNGARVRDGRLRPGDALELGEVSGRFLEMAPGSAASRSTAARPKRGRRWLGWLGIVAALVALAAAWRHLAR